MEQVVRHAIITSMKHKKILPKHHTGKLVHHRHTSYSALVGVLIMTTIPLFMMSREAANAAPTDPVTEEYSTYAVVPGPIPRTAPVITSPGQGTVFTSNDPVAVSGSCPNDMLIKVFKNDVLAGAVFCQAGRFSVDVDLFPASNALVARAYNANNNVGPDSAVVTVRRDVLGLTTNPNVVPADRFFITSDIQYKGSNAGETLTRQLTISGGQAPYAVSVSWGDGKTDLISRSQAGPFEVSHVYKNAGEGPQNSFDITVLATDQSGTKSFIHLVAIVNGDKPSVVSTIKAGSNWSGALKIAWQLVVLAAVIVFSFWVGERREAFMLKRKIKSA